jgi:DNA-binding CsgD family transcriptional regulator
VIPAARTGARDGWRPGRYARTVRVSRQGRSPVMVGREQELHRLVGLLGTRSTPAVALIAGEAGLGKTRLVQEVVDSAPDTTVVLAGQADPGALGRPFELLLDAVEALCVDEDERTLIDAVTDESSTFESRVRSAVELVRAITRDRPTLIVFDDLHWADAESLALFERLAQPDAGPLLLVGTYRPDGLSRRHPAAELLPRLDRRHDVVHLRLRPLLPTEVSQFLTAATDQRPSYRVVEALHTRTSGNPYFLEELLAASPGADLEALVDQPLPWNLAEAVRAQLDDLDPDERQVVDAASVLGRRVPFDLLASVLEIDERELIAALRKLVGRAFLVETENDVFAFHHELAREAVEGELLGRERRRLHEAALAALQADGTPDLAAVARHAQGAGRYDDMVEAARQGAARYLASGSSYTALQLAELGLSEGEDLELRAAAARAAWLVDLGHDADVHAERWLHAARAAGDLAEEALALELLARLAYDLEDRTEVPRRVAALEELVDRCDDSEVCARAMAGLSQVLMLTERADDAVRWADRTIALADSLDLEDVRVAAMVEKGSALTHRHEPVPEGITLLAQAADAARAADLPILEARALHNLVFADLLRPDPALTRERLERMRDAAERAGFDSMAIGAYHEALSQLEYAAGDLDAARDMLARPRRAGWTIGTRGKHGWYHLFEAELALEAGELPAAADFLQQVDPDEGTERRAAWACLHATIAVLGGDRAEAVRRIDQAGAVARAEGSPVEAFLLLLGAARHLGYDVGALARSGELLVCGAGELATAAQRALADAVSAEEAGDLEVALDRYLLTDLGGAGSAAAPHRGTAAVGAGRVAVALGTKDDARAHLERAEAHLAGWGGWRLAELAALRRRLGADKDVSGPDTLTPREREVVALLTEGLTNVEIADRLYISPRTVGVHVSNVLAKLAMSSRAEVAAWAVRESRSS